MLIVIYDHTGSLPINVADVDRLAALRARIASCARRTRPQLVTRPPKPKDDKFLDVALNGEAQLILTGDQDLLALHLFHGVEILSPADFMQRPVD